MKYSESDIKRIYEKIEKHSVELKNGCIDWNGKRDRENPILGKVYITKFLWELEYPDDPRLSNEIFTRTCDLKYCLNFDHIQKKSKQNYISREYKQRIWKQLLAKSERQVDCLIWKSLKTTDGYGKTSFYKVNYSTHKLSFWIHNDYDTPQEIPLEDEEFNRLVIRHSCGNRACMEPSHLSLGTSSENALDQHYHGTALFGEKNPSASITEETARQIKHSRYDKGDPNYKNLTQRAKLFNVSINIVWAIDRNITWAHIPDRDGKLINRSEELSEKRKIERNKAKNREWTDEMWQQASESLNKRLMILDSVTSEHVDSSCHLWTGPINDRDYGIYITVFGRRRAPHILACEIKNKQVRPKDMVTRHLCANKICCNPDHLEWGSYSENSIDSIRHGSKAASVMNEVLVKEIRETKGKDGLSQEERAKKYKVRKKYLREIETGRVWKHVT